MRTYKLNASRKDRPFYKKEDVLRDEKKRSYFFFEASTIEEFDKLTAKFTSFSDMTDEFNDICGIKLEFNYPYIIVDLNDSDYSKSYAIDDIVYMEDLENIKDYEMIKCNTINCLLENSDSVREFRGINKIYKTKYPNRVIDEYIANSLVLAYFKTYKNYRDAYFTLKDLGYYKEKGHNEVRK